jgi:hypothetical protein
VPAAADAVMRFPTLTPWASPPPSRSGGVGAEDAGQQESLPPPLLPGGHEVASYARLLQAVSALAANSHDAARRVQAYSQQRCRLSRLAASWNAGAGSPSPGCHDHHGPRRRSQQGGALPGPLRAASGMSLEGLLCSPLHAGRERDLCSSPQPSPVRGLASMRLRAPRGAPAGSAACGGDAFAVCGGAGQWPPPQQATAQQPSQHQQQQQSQPLGHGTGAVMPLDLFGTFSAAGAQQCTAHEQDAASDDALSACDSDSDCSVRERRGAAEWVVRTNLAATGVSQDTAALAALLSRANGASQLCAALGARRVCHATQ